MSKKIDSLLAQELVKRGIVSKELIDRIMEKGIPFGENLISILVRQGAAGEKELLAILSEKLGLPYINLKKLSIAQSVIEKVPFKIASHYKFMPLKIENNVMTIAVSYPLDVSTQDEIKMQLGYDIEMFLSFQESILEALNRYYSQLKEQEEKKSRETATTSVIPPAEKSTVLQRPQSKGLSITTKFILWFLFISVLPLTVATYISYTSSQRILKREAANSLFAIADNKANQIEIYLREKKSHLIALSHSSEIIDIIEKFSEAIGKGGIGSPRYRAVEQEFRPFFEYQQRVYGYDDIFLIDASGNIIFSVNRKNYRELYKDSEMMKVFIKTTASLKPEISNFEYYPEDRKAAVFITAPVFKEAALAGIVMAQIGTQGIYDLLQDYTGLGKTGEILIASKIGDKAVFITPLRFDADAVFKRKVDIGSEEGLDIQYAVQGKEGSGVSTDYRGKEVWAIWRYLPIFRLGMVVKMDTSEILATANQLRDTLFRIGSILLVVVIVMAVIIARSVANPIKELTRVSSIISRGDLSARAKIATRDEVEELAHSFNQMTDSLVEAKNKVEEERAKLEEQKVLLEKANQELDSFVYTASHDLRAPLRGISSFASFLEEDYRDRLDDEGKGYLDEIRKGAHRMDKLIEDLLALSRISRIKNPYEDVDMGELINSINERIKFDIQKNNVDMRIQKDMPTVYCDRIKIGEVLLNLINNAIKFSSKGNKENPKVEIGYADEDGYYKFYVKDNGIGIEPKYQSQIFGIFKRLHTAEEYEGTGAGLSIVKRVIDDHGGKIWVESELGKGATFYFTIPTNLKEKER